MGKIVEVGIGIVVLIMMVSWFIVPIVTETNTDNFTDNFESTTGGGETSDTVTLSQSHYYDTSENMSVSSDLGTDNPAILSYTTSTEEVEVGGLTASGTRILSVSYIVESSNLDIFTGWEHLTLILPALIIIMGIYWLFKSGFAANLGSRGGF